MTWEDLEKKYNIKFKLKNGEFRPVNEWLDDIYLKLNSSAGFLLFCDILFNGEGLFANVLTHKE